MYLIQQNLTIIYQLYHIMCDDPTNDNNKKFNNEIHKCTLVFK